MHNVDGGSRFVVSFEGLVESVSETRFLKAVSRLVESVSETRFVEDC